MISFKSPFENINVVIPDPKSFFSIAVPVTDDVSINPKGTRTLSAKAVSTFFINGKAVVNGLRKLRNPFWLLIFIAVPFNKTYLVIRDLMTFKISFISLLVSVTAEP